MKRKIPLILFVAGALALGYRQLRRPPPGLHGLLWEFSRTDDPKEKLDLAIRLQLGALLSPNGKPEWSEDERHALAAAQELVDTTLHEAREFESRLSPSDIAQITQDNPDSFYRFAGFFSTEESARVCTKEHYTAIRDKIGLRDLLTRGSSIGPLVGLYDQRFRSDYSGRVIDLIKGDPRFTSYSNLAEAYYPIGLELHQKLNGRESDARMREYESQLAATGLEREKIKDYAFQLAAQSPNCLGKISTEFFGFLHEDVTRTRGKFLLEQLRAYVQTNGQAPADLRELPLETADPLFGSALDGWSNEFSIRGQGREIQLVSPGRDGKLGTADDIVIGEGAR